MKKSKRKTKPQIKSYKKSALKLLLYVVLAAITFPFVLIFTIKSGVFGKLPNEEQLANIQNFEASEVYTSDDVLLGRYYIQNRTELKYDEISPLLINALVSTEDKRFYNHHGIDYRSLMRVLFKTLLLQDRSSGGGSTITQQLVKNIYGRQDHSYLSMAITKIKEMLIALEVEKIYSKEEILALYLNTVPFGESIYGVETACQRFFQKDANEVNVQEAATLIGLLKATSYYSPRLHPERSKGRRNVVLLQMQKSDHLSTTEVDSLSNLPIELNYKPENQNVGLAPYFREEIRKNLNKMLPRISDSLGRSYNIYTDGLKIYTTLDSRLQVYAEKAVNRHMRALQKSFDTHWENRKKPWEHDVQILQTSLKGTNYYQQMQKAKYSSDSIEYYVNQKREMDIYSWDGKNTRSMSTMDSIKFYLGMLNTGVLSVDPGTGQIKAWVGGINYQQFKYDHVNIQSKRQVGSIFKPIVYATALEQDVSPCDYIKAEQKTYKEQDEEWSPSNANSNYEGKYSFEGALTESVNTVSVKVLETAGIGNTIELARQLGIKSDIPNVPSIALGTPSISLYEMVNAFCVFPNQGKEVNPYLITRIEDKEGQVIWKHKTNDPRQVVSSSTSQMMIEMLKNVVNGGTAVRLRSTYNLPNDIAGKTGTTQSNADGWFVAITPKLVTGVWVGGEYPSIHFRTTRLGQGANMALPIYALYQKQINRDSQKRQIATARFPYPPASVQAALDCDPFKEDLNFWQTMFGTKEERVKAKQARQAESPTKTYSKKPVPKKKEKGLFKNIKKLFKKKNKD